MLNGLTEHQIYELQKSLNMLPPCFDDVKNEIISGNGYWYPLCKAEPVMKTAVYSADRIYKDDMIDLIKNIFEKSGIKEAKGYHPYWFEGQPTWRNIPDMRSFLYERDDTGYNFPWIHETYYFDKSETWIIYISHEGTITFAGEQLVRIAEGIIPEIYRYPK